MRRILTILMTLLFLESCQTRIVERVEYRDRVEKADEVILRSDSVFVYQSPDTFIQYKERRIYINKTDTLTRTDSVKVEVPVYINKEKVRYNKKPIIILSIILILTYGIIIRKKILKG